MAAGQVATSAAKAAKGTVRLWMRQNGQDVANSNTEQTINGSFTGVLVCQGIMECKAGDKVELLQSAGGTGLGMVASTPKGEPVGAQHDPFDRQSERRRLRPIVQHRNPGRRRPKARSSRSIRPTPPRTSKTTKAPSRSKRPASTSWSRRARWPARTAAARDRPGCGCGRTARTSLTPTPNSPIVDKYTAVLVCQGVGEVKAGDKLQLCSPPKAPAWAWSPRRPRANRSFPA